MYGLVREFLEFFNLEFTAAVLEPEANAVSIGQKLVCFKTLQSNVYILTDGPVFGAEGAGT